jgi:hypothetical protein
MPRLAALVLAGLLPAAAAASTVPPVLAVAYCWHADVASADCPEVLVELRPDGTLTALGRAGRWRRDGDALELAFDDHPGLVYAGVRDGRCFAGRMDAGAHTGAWRGCPR